MSYFQVKKKTEKTEPNIDIGSGFEKLENMT